jgi:hypothetical protein
MNVNVERYLTPKGIADALDRDYGLQLSPDYIRAIRQESIRRGEETFIGGFGRASDVFRFLQKNPGFSRRMAKRGTKKT